MASMRMSASIWNECEGKGGLIGFILSLAAIRVTAGREGTGIEKGFSTTDFMRAVYT